MRRYRNVAIGAIIGLLIVKAEGTTQEGIEYESRKIDNHVIHIVVLDPKIYPLELVKAREQVVGRETVQSIAARKNAVVAINGGFFEIGNSEDGRPSGTLIINGLIYGLKRGPQDMLLLEEGKISICRASVEVTLRINEEKIIPTQVNQLAASKEIVIYTHSWGTHSLTPYDRKEIICDDKGKISAVVPHGDNAIPQKGFIVSLSTQQPFPTVKEGQMIDIDVELREPEGKLLKIHPTSILMGIPMLVKEGKIVIGGKSGNFYNQTHARTALGLRPDGKVVVVVVEHVYTQPLKEVTLGQVHAILKEKGLLPYLERMMLPEVQKIIETHYSVRGSTVGLTVYDLAALLVELDCDTAINLDGGGSSTFLLEGRIMNTTCGDEDENRGQNRLRPVSDAVIFRRSH